MGHGVDRFEVGRAGALPPGEEADWLIGPSVARAAGLGPGAIGSLAPIGAGRPARTRVGLLTATGAVLGAPRDAGLAMDRTERGAGTAVGTRWGAGGGAGAGAIRRAGLAGTASTTVAGFVDAVAIDLVAGRLVAFADGGAAAAGVARGAACRAGAFVALGCAFGCVLLG